MLRFRYHLSTAPIIIIQLNRRTCNKCCWLTTMVTITRCEARNTKSQSYRWCFQRKPFPMRRCWWILLCWCQSPRWYCGVVCIAIPQGLPCHAVTSKYLLHDQSAPEQPSEEYFTEANSEFFFALSNFSASMECHIQFGWPGLASCHGLGEHWSRTTLV